MWTSPLCQVSELFKFLIGSLLESHPTDVSVNKDGALSRGHLTLAERGCLLLLTTLLCRGLCSDHSGKEGCGAVSLET